MCIIICGTQHVSRLDLQFKNNEASIRVNSQQTLQHTLHNVSSYFISFFFPRFEIIKRSSAAYEELLTARASRERAEIAILARSDRQDFHCDGTPSVLRYFTRSYGTPEFYAPALYPVPDYSRCSGDVRSRITCALYFIPIRTSEELYPPPRVKIRMKFLFTSSFAPMYISPITPTRLEKSYSVFRERFILSWWHITQNSLSRSSASSTFYVVFFFFVVVWRKEDNLKNNSHETIYSDKTTTYTRLLSLARSLVRYVCTGKICKYVGAVDDIVAPRRFRFVCMRIDSFPTKRFTAWGAQWHLNIMS